MIKFIATAPGYPEGVTQVTQAEKDFLKARCEKIAKQQAFIDWLNEMNEFDVKLTRREEETMEIIGVDKYSEYTQKLYHDKILLRKNKPEV